MPREVAAGKTAANLPFQRNLIKQTRSAFHVLPSHRFGRARQFARNQITAVDTRNG